jgi:hypothetical protein
MAEKRTLVDRVNGEIDELRQSMRERVGESDGSTPDDFPDLPNLEAKDEDSTFEQWYDDNVRPLADSLEEYKRKLSQRDEDHSKLVAKVEVVTDLLPNRDSN